MQLKSSRGRLMFPPLSTVAAYSSHDDKILKSRNNILRLARQLTYIITQSYNFDETFHEGAEQARGTAYMEQIYAIWVWLGVNLQSMRK